MEIAGKHRHVSPAVGDYALEESAQLLARIEKLETVLQAFSETVERIAFEIPAPNTFTPRFVQIAQTARAALEAK